MPEEKKENPIFAFFKFVMKVIVIPFGKAKGWWQRRGHFEPPVPRMRDRRDRHRP